MRLAELHRRPRPPRAELQGLRGHVPRHQGERERGRATALLSHSDVVGVGSVKGVCRDVEVLLHGDQGRAAQAGERVAQGSLLDHQSNWGNEPNKRLQITNITVNNYLKNNKESI